MVVSAQVKQSVLDVQSKHGAEQFVHVPDARYSLVELHFSQVSPAKLHLRQ